MNKLIIYNLIYSDFFPQGEYYNDLIPYAMNKFLYATDFQYISFFEFRNKCGAHDILHEIIN